jgi:hypothetical protein
MYQKAVKYTRWPLNGPNGNTIYLHLPSQHPPKFTQTGIFGSKTNHLAAQPGCFVHALLKLLPFRRHTGRALRPAFRAARLGKARTSAAAAPHPVGRRKRKAEIKFLTTHFQFFFFFFFFLFFLRGSVIPFPIGLVRLRQDCVARYVQLDCVKIALNLASQDMYN